MPEEPVIHKGKGYPVYTINGMKNLNDNYIEYDTTREDIELSDIIYRNGADIIFHSDEKDMEKQKQLYEKIKSW